jgi:hypothetical protein
VAAAWVFALVVPATNVTVFDGLPLSSLPEFFVSVLLVLVFASTSARRELAGLVRAHSKRACTVLLVAALLIAALKLITLAAPVEGFGACYGNPVRPYPGGKCERSYENLWFRDHLSRYDSRIDFGPINEEGYDSKYLSGSDWNLSFINEIRLNVFQRPGNVAIERLPFSATWRGKVNAGRGGTVRIVYVGEGRVRIGARSVDLRPSYSTPGMAEVQVESGTQPLLVTYRFNDRYVIGSLGPRGPYGTLRIGAVGARDPGADPLRPVADALGWRAVGVTVDVAFAAVGALLVLAYALALRRSWRLVVGAVGAGLIAWALESVHRGYGPAVLPIAPSVLVLVGILVFLAVRHPDDLALIGAPAALACAFGRTLAQLPSLDYVIFRSRGDDWLTYQFFGRVILEKRSLQGGENVYFYQPAYRYIAFAEHALFGDADGLRTVVGVAAVLGAVFVLVHSVVRRRTTIDSRRIVCIVAAAALLVVLASAPVVQQISYGVSEYPTWALLPLVLPLLFLRQSLARWMLGTAALGLCYLIRPNQGIPVVVLFGIFALLNWRRARTAVLICSAVLVGLLLVPAVHNLWYGGRLEVLPTSASSSANEVLRPDQLPDVFSDGGVRRVLESQLAGLLYLDPTNPRAPDIGVGLLALQVVWLMAVVVAIRRRRQVPWAGWWLLAWPLTFALYAVVYEIAIYYPRHLIAMYVATGATVIYLAERGAPRATDEQPARPELLTTSS